jgi:anaerobic selenocysteine-containing dehydrogenase
LAADFAPPIRALFVYNCNPLATLPAQNKVRAGLEREDLFTVVHEQVLTDTARYADVLLPATTFLEHREVRRSYGAMLAQSASAVMQPVGESRPNYWLFDELCQRLGLAREGEPRTPDELLKALVGTSRDAGRIADDLESTGQSAPPCGTRPVQFVDVLPATPDGKIDFVPALLDAEAPGGMYHYRPDPATTAFPLALVSPSTSEAISSTLYGRVDKQVPVTLHPLDATARGIADGDPVDVENELGLVRCIARVSDEMRPGVAMLPKGLWAKHTGNGQTANALAPDTLTDLGGGACFNDARVEIRRAVGRGSTAAGTLS